MSMGKRKVTTQRIQAAEKSKAKAAKRSVRVPRVVNRSTVIELGPSCRSREGDWRFYEPELSTICAISTYSIVGATP